MYKYELTILSKEVGDWEGKMEKLIKALGGKLGRMVEMGKKQLAYVIKKQSEAHYLSWSLELPGEMVVQLEKKLTNDVASLRHLLVRV